VSGLVDVSVAGVTKSGAVTVMVATGPGVNQPVGMTQVYDNAMSRDPHAYTSAPGDADGFFVFGDNGSRVTQETDINAPASPPDFWRMTTAIADPAFDSIWRAIAGNAFPANTGEWYARIRIRFSSAFTLGTSGNQVVKFFSPRLADPNHNTFVCFHSVDLATGIGVQLEQQLTDGPPDSWNSTTGMSRSAWHDMEMLATPCTPGTANGRFQVWIDGTELAWNKAATDVLWTLAGGNQSLAYCQIDWIYGVKAWVAAQTFDIDHWYLSVRES
jgi:hypothetical protein